MAAPQGIKVSTPDAVVTGIVGMFSLLFLAIWAGYCAVLILISGFYIGDGSSRTGPTLSSNVLWLPSIYLLIVATSAMTFVRRGKLAFFAVAGHAVLVPSLLMVAHTQGINPIIIRISLVTFVVIDCSWLVLICLRFRSYTALP